MCHCLNFRQGGMLGRVSREPENFHKLIGWHPRQMSFPIWQRIKQLYSKINHIHKIKIIKLLFSHLMGKKNQVLWKSVRTGKRLMLWFLLPWQKAILSMSWILPFPFGLKPWHIFVGTQPSLWVEFFVLPPSDSCPSASFPNQGIMTNSGSSRLSTWLRCSQ